MIIAIKLEWLSSPLPLKENSTDLDLTSFDLDLTFIGVGIGNQTKRSELVDMATDEHHILMVKSFNDLLGYVHRAAVMACQGKNDDELVGQTKMLCAPRPTTGRHFVFAPG